MPSHLRDANRDGDAFGDGVGYRYPHAYAEHWVEQQYLPTALQGEVFWQPGQLGWEGERRERMAERRAAQLAAAAELAPEQPLMLSSGPDSPAMERWIQRQLGQEGERLHLLRQRLWADVDWQRQDRVLLLGCHSLLWALDPLRRVPEGGVTLICPSPDDLQRLAAQIDLLEPERQPQLLDGLEALPSDQVFDWIGGRLGTADLPEMNWTELAQFLTGHADRNARLRLLISCAVQGPAGALTAASQVAATSLSPLVEQEQHWLQQLQIQMQPLVEQGWSLNTEQWDEVLTLPGGQSLAERWLAKDSAYRRMLGSIKHEPLQLLRTTLEGLGSEGLRLQMRHQLITGKQVQEKSVEQQIL